MPIIYQETRRRKKGVRSCLVSIHQKMCGSPNQRESQKAVRIEEPKDIYGLTRASKTVVAVARADKTIKKNEMFIIPPNN